MAEHHASNYVAPNVEVDLAPLKKAALLAAVIGSAAWLIMGGINLTTYSASEAAHEHGGVRDFFLTYQAGYVYWLSIPVGAMTLSYLAWLTSASWGLVLRRCFQAATRTWPVLLLLFLPVALSSIFLGEESPFWWVVPANQNEEFKQSASQAFIDEQMHRQEMYLNPIRFLVFSAAIFGLYVLLSRCLNNWSPKAEDEGDHSSYVKLRRIAGPAVILWALTWTILMTDIVMSVEVSWASTMFPVVSAMNSFLCAMAFSTFILYTLIGKNEPVLSIIKDKFRIDIGSLMFGFTMVWCYATFSQYMLIWAGNLPEEIGYILKRTSGGWEWMAYLLMLVHWFLPFVLFLFRGNKTDPVKMRRLTVMLLVICAVDVIWWIVPAYPHAHQWLHVPMAIAAIIGIGGIWSLSFFNQLQKRNLLPKKDTEFLATWGHHH